MADVPRIVLVTARDDVRAGVLRLAALAGAQVDALSGSSGLRPVWRAAHVVIIGSDLARAVAAAALPRRPDVVILATEDPDPALWRAGVELGAAEVLSLPADEQGLVELISAAVEERTALGATLAVIGGCGGAGASTLAAALAVTAARVGPTLLVDGDRFGGGLDVLLGAEQQPGARWPDLASTRGRLGVAALTDALVQAHGVTVLSWDRSGSAELVAEAAAAVMDAAVRGFRTVIIDLPRFLDGAALLLAAAADLVLVVVPATVRAVAAAAAVAAEVVGQCGPVRLVVRDARAGHLGVAEVGVALGLPVATSLRSDPGVAAAAERGEPPVRRARGSLHDACQGLLDATSADLAA